MTQRSCWFALPTATKRTPLRHENSGSWPWVALRLPPGEHGGLHFSPLGHHSFAFGTPETDWESAVAGVSEAVFLLKGLNPAQNGDQKLGSLNNSYLSCEKQPQHLLSPASLLLSASHRRLPSGTLATPSPLRTGCADWPGGPQLPCPLIPRSSKDWQST